MLLIGLTIVIVTGLLSNDAYQPGLFSNSLGRKLGPLDVYLFGWPTSPVWLYALNQGLHVTIGLALVPVLLAKLWSVIPRLFEWPPVRSLSHMLERLSLALLVGGALFEFVTGIMNIQYWYAFKFDFPQAHYYGAWVFIGAFLAHVCLKFGTMRRGLRMRREVVGLAAPVVAVAPEAPVGPVAAAAAAAEPLTPAASEPLTRAEPEPLTPAEPEPLTPAEPEPRAPAEPEPRAPAEPEPLTRAEPDPLTPAEPSAAPEPRTGSIPPPGWREPAPPGRREPARAAARAEAAAPAPAAVPVAAAPATAAGTHADGAPSLTAPDPAPGTMSRRALLGTVAAGSVILAVQGAAQSIGGPLRSLAFLLPRGRTLPGPLGFPINKTAAAAGVTVPATGSSWRLELVGQRTVFISREQLLALPQHTYELPIACVEGWSTTQHWTGVRLRDLAALCEVTGPARVYTTSLDPGTYGHATLGHEQVADDQALLALRVNGIDLSLDHGFPARVICPAVPGDHNTKWVTNMKFTPVSI